MDLSHIENEAAYHAAIKRNIIANARKTWITTYGEQAQMILEDAAFRGHFEKMTAEEIQALPLLNKLAYSLHTFGKLTEKQTALYVRILEQRQAQKQQRDSEMAARYADKKWVGAVGDKKVAFDVTVVHYSAEPVQYGYARGVRQFIIMSDSDGNSLQYSGSSFPLVEKGDRLTFTANIKDHNEHPKYGKSTKVGMIKNLVIVKEEANV